MENIYDNENCNNLLLQYEEEEEFEYNIYL